METFNLETIKTRLTGFGYAAKDEDEPVLQFCIGKVTNTILNETDQTEVPEGLEHIAVDMVCGEFLQVKKTFAPEDLSTLDLDAAVSSVTTGDTTTQFSTDGYETDEQRLDAFIQWLLTYGRSEFLRYRRLVW